MSDWNKHAGTKCPVDHGVVVFIRGNNPNEWCCGLAGEFNWSDDIDPDGRVHEWKYADMGAAMQTLARAINTGTGGPVHGLLRDARCVLTEKEAREAAGAAPAAAVGDLSSNAAGTGARFNAGKAPLHLIPAGIMADLTLVAPPVPGPVPWGFVLGCLGDFQMRVGGGKFTLLRALAAMASEPGMWEECARVFEYGTRKYAAWNWAKGMPWTVPIGCALRHIVLGIEQGEQNDPESGLPHRGHVVCNIVMLLWFLDHCAEGDDRRTLPKAVR